MTINGCTSQKTSQKRKATRLHRHKSMSFTIFAILLVLVGATWSFIHRRSSYDRKLPPGPPPLPIIGNLHMLATLPHRSLKKLSEKYGPIMSLRLGSVPTIVISSPEAVELFLKTYDTVFASRPIVQASQFMSYGTKGVVLTPYGPYWRSVRKLCMIELLGAAKLDLYGDMRKEVMATAVESIKAAPTGEAVDVSERVQWVVEEMTYRMIFGGRSDQSVDLREIVHEMLELAGAFNLSDYIPFLAPLDLQGLARRMKRANKTFDQIFERIIDEHEQEARENQTPQGDFIHVLLSLMNKSSNSSSSGSTHDQLPDFIDRDSIKAIGLDMVIGSLDTSSTAIEWIMTELLKHPRIMKKVQEEINSVVRQDRMVEENDLCEFKYLEMVIKETFRFHPVTPLSVPHESMEDVDINGYLIPKKTRLFVNYWAMGQDPRVWSENVGEFLPERFLDSEIDFKGRHFQLIPFGTGRRGCPGMNLGMINIRLVVSHLVHCFDWELPGGMLPNELDTTEKFGLSLPRATNLFAVPTYRLYDGGYWIE